MATTFFLFATTIATWNMLQVLSSANFVLAALATAGLLLSKATAIVVLPIDLVMLGVSVIHGPSLSIHLIRRAWAAPSRTVKAAALGGSLVLCFALAFVIVWSAYGFRYWAINIETLKPGCFYKITSIQTLGHLVPPSWSGPLCLSAPHRLLPEAYVFGARIRTGSSASRKFLSWTSLEHGMDSLFSLLLSSKDSDTLTHSLGPVDHRRTQTRELPKPHSGG